LPLSPLKLEGGPPAFDAGRLWREVERAMLLSAVSPVNRL
jgi:hypothetical protein